MDWLFIYALTEMMKAKRRRALRKALPQHQYMTAKDIKETNDILGEKILRYTFKFTGAFLICFFVGVIIWYLLVGIFVFSGKQFKFSEKRKAGFMPAFSVYRSALWLMSTLLRFLLRVSFPANLRNRFLLQGNI